jgi:DNA-binding GntR family transcriptional regulator
MNQLAQEFGSSRTPVREALMDLAHDGLVEMAPRRGVRVTGLTAEQVRDNFSVLGALSGVAAEWATLGADERFLAQLDGRIQALREAVSGDELIRANWAFHSEINRACGSPRLRDLIGKLSRMVPAGYFNIIPEQVDVSAREHEVLYQAIRSGRADDARRIAQRHVHQAGVQMAERLLHPPAPDALTRAGAR